MRKYLVIDSLARSGTTLLSALLRSQKNTTIFCPGFNESIAAEGIDWPHGFARHDILPRDIAINLEQYKKDSISNIENFSQLNGHSISDYEKIINTGDSPKEIIEGVGDMLNTDILGFRWNQGLLYINNWLTDSNKYWLSVIRNPLDRALSSFKKHRWTIDDSLISTIEYTKKIESIKHKDNFIQIYYEDLITKPEATIKYIYQKMGIKLDTIELNSIKGSNGNSFIPQPSSLSGDKVDGYYEGDTFNGLYTNKIDGYKTSVDNKWIPIFRTALGFSKIYDYYKI